MALLKFTVQYNSDLETKEQYPYKLSSGGWVPNTYGLVKESQPFLEVAEACNIYQGFLNNPADYLPTLMMYSLKQFAKSFVEQKHEYLLCNLKANWKSFLPDVYGDQANKELLDWIEKYVNAEYWYMANKKLLDSASVIWLGSSGGMKWAVNHVLSAIFEWHHERGEEFDTEDVRPYPPGYTLNTPSYSVWTLNDQGCTETLLGVDNDLKAATKMFKSHKGNAVILDREETVIEVRGEYKNQEAKVE